MKLVGWFKHVFSDENATPPTARWPFRLLATLFVLAAGAASFGIARSWLRGEWTPGWETLGELGTLFACVVMTLAFAWIALAGRLPDWLWRLLMRASKGA